MTTTKHTPPWALAANLAQALLDARERVIVADQAEAQASMTTRAARASYDTAHNAFYEALCPDAAGQVLLLARSLVEIARLRSEQEA